MLATQHTSDAVHASHAESSSTTITATAALVASKAARARTALGATSSPPPSSKSPSHSPTARYGRRRRTFGSFSSSTASGHSSPDSDIMLASLLNDGGSPPKRPKKSRTAYPVGSRASDERDAQRSSSGLRGSSTTLLLQHQQQQGLAAAAAAALEQQQQHRSCPHPAGFAPRAVASTTATAGAPLRHTLMQAGRSCSPPTAALRAALTLRDTPERDTSAMREVYGQQRVAYRRKPLRKDSGLDSSSGTIDGSGRGDLTSASAEAMLRTEEDEAMETDMESEDMEVPVPAPMSASDTMASKAMARAHSLRRRLSRAAGLVASQAMATPIPTPEAHGLGAISPKGPTTALRDQTPSPPRHRQAPAAAVAAAHSPVTPGSPRPQRFGLPASEEPALAKPLDYITPEKLASLLQQQGVHTSVLLLDCRAALAYAHTRLPGAVHVQFSALMLRRFKRRARCPITVSDLKTSDAARLQLRHDSSTLVVVYDDDTHDARPDSPVGVLVRILRDENVEPICLRGGMTGFRGLFANLLEAPAAAAAASPAKAAPQVQAPAHAPVEAPAHTHAAAVEQRLPATTAMMATPQEHAPATQPATTVFDFLMLGNSAQGTDLAFLRHHGITHIINVTQRPFAPEVVRVAKCMQIPLQDGPGHDLLSILPQALRVIDTARMEGGRVLLYCSDGLSRAAAITLAYFISTRHFTLRSAFATLLRLRPAINPHEAFVEQLAQYEGIVMRAAQHNAVPPRNVPPPAAATRRSRLKSRV